MLDGAPGERMLLHEARYARIVRDALLRGESEHGLYSLAAWVIQHNHVHVLMQANAGTVHIANTFMNASEAAAGRKFWERESYERVLRNERECEEAVRFVEQHPVRLGLVDQAEDWEWSSAHLRQLSAPLPGSAWRNRAYQSLSCGVLPAQPWQPTTIQ